MDTERWQPARLIPTTGISGQDEQEMRATSALLAVLTAVREFGSALLRPLGAPAGTVTTFIEVPFELSDGRKLRPDGFVRVARGNREWSALVEVKTGTSDLGREQVEAYLDLARENGIDCVLTISNQIAPSEGVHPLEVDKRKTKKVALCHLSWAEVLSTAVAQRVHRGVSDPDQAWILAELIRYLEHPRSGALDFADMGGSWVPIREALSAGTLRPSDRGIGEVVARWEQLLRFAALRLERELGTGVQVVVSKKELADANGKRARQVDDLVNRQLLAGTLRIPNTVGDLVIVADLRSNRCQVSVDLPGPAEGRALTRVNWLVRQLSEAPDQLRVDAFVHLARNSSSDLLKVVRENPSMLVGDPKADVRRFRLTATSPLGSKRGTGRGAFIDSVLASVSGFYADVLQQVRPWQPKVPQLPKEGTAVHSAGIDTTVGPDVAAVASVDNEPFDDAVAATEVVMPTDGVELVSWDDQLDDLANERSLTGPLVGASEPVPTAVAID